MLSILPQLFVDIEKRYGKFPNAVQQTLVITILQLHTYYYCTCKCTIVASQRIDKLISAMAMNLDLHQGEVCGTKIFFILSDHLSFFSSHDILPSA